MQSKKGISAVVVIFVILVAGIMVFVSTTDFSSQVKTSSFESAQEKTTAGSIEGLKSTIEGGAQNAIVRSCLDLAKESAGANKGYWIVYSTENVPDFYLTRGLLEEKIMDYTNIFLSSIEGVIINNVNITESGEITNVSVIVDLVNFSFGENDNYFESVFNGTTLFAQQDSQQVSFEHEYTIAPSPPIRFFRLLRIFTEWVKEGVLSQTACNYLPIMLTKSGNYNSCPYYVTTNETILKLISESIVDLNSKLGNEYVCGYVILCNTSSDIYEINTPPQSVGCTCYGVCSPARCSHPGSGEKVPGYNCDFSDSFTYDNCTLSTEGCNVNLPYNKTVNIIPERMSGVEWPLADVKSDWCSSFGEKRSLSFVINVTCNDTKYLYFSNEQLSFSALLHVSLERYSPAPSMSKCIDYEDPSCSSSPSCADSCGEPCDERPPCKDSCLICKPSSEGLCGCFWADLEEAQALADAGHPCLSQSVCPGVCTFNPNTEGYLDCKVDTTKTCNVDGCTGKCTETGCQLDGEGSCRLANGCEGVCKKGAYGCQKPDNYDDKICCNGEWTLPSDCTSSHGGEPT